MSETKDIAVVPRQTAVTTRWRMTPSTLGEAMEMANLIAGSELCPKAYRGRPQDCIVAYEYGAALGLAWMQSLRSVSVINGQAALWGDAIPALIYGSGECERFHEAFKGTKGQDDYTAVCIMKRRGMPDEVVSTFSVADAKVAKLWGKRGRDGQDTPWVTYPDRMLKMRARGFAARDTFADKLSGLILAEEAMDYDTVEGSVVRSEEVPQPAPWVAILERVPEALRDNISKAFASLNMSTPNADGSGWTPSGLGVAKLNEHLGGAGVDPEAGALSLLEWCKDEWARRKTGQPRQKREGNGKQQRKTETQTTSAPPAGGVVPGTGESAGHQGQSESTDHRPGSGDRTDQPASVAVQEHPSTPVAAPAVDADGDIF